MNNNSFTPEEIREAKLELCKAMTQLSEAWIACLDAISNIAIEANDYIVDEYPFDKSFDDLSVCEWCDSVREKLSFEDMGAKKQDPCDIPDENGNHVCPFADTYTGYEDEMCRNCCGKGVDE